MLDARIDSSRVKLDAARSELRRKEALRERSIGTPVDVEDAQTKVRSAEAALREAEAIAAAQENKILGAKADVARVRSELDTAVATLPQKRALLEVAEIDLDRTTIRAPIDGIIVGRNVNEGQTLATTLEAKTLFTVAGNLNQMEIHAKVDEADIGKIRVGQDATFTVDAHPGRQFAATVRQVRKAPQVIQNVVTYAVVLSAANPEKLLLPGMTALVRITVNRTGPVLKVPLAALRYAPKAWARRRGGAGRGHSGPARVGLDRGREWRAEIGRDRPWRGRRKPRRRDQRPALPTRPGHRRRGRDKRPAPALRHSDRAVEVSDASRGSPTDAALRRGRRGRKRADGDVVCDRRG